MPRKQRFKPSRKPQSTQGVVSSQQIDDRKDVVPEQRDIETQAPVRNENADIERDRD